MSAPETTVDLQAMTPVANEAQSVADDLSWGRYCLLAAHADDLHARAYELRALAEQAYPYNTAAAQEESVEHFRAMERHHRLQAEEHRKAAREAGENTAAPTMSGMIRALGGDDEWKGADTREEARGEV